MDSPDFEYLDSERLLREARGAIAASKEWNLMVSINPADGAICLGLLDAAVMRSLAWRGPVGEVLDALLAGGDPHERMAVVDLLSVGEARIAFVTRAERWLQSDASLGAIRGAGSGEIFANTVRKLGQEAVELAAQADDRSLERLLRSLKGSRRTVRGRNLEQLLRGCEAARQRLPTIAEGLVGEGDAKLIVGMLRWLRWAPDRGDWLDRLLVWHMRHHAKLAGARREARRVARALADAIDSADGELLARPRRCDHSGSNSQR